MPRLLTATEEVVASGTLVCRAGETVHLFLFFSFKQENIESYGYFQLRIRGFLLIILDFIFIALSFTLKILVPDEVICSLCFSK